LKLYCQLCYEAGNAVPGHRISTCVVVAAWVPAPPPVEDHAVAVSVARNLAQHDCVIEYGDSGVVADTSARSVSLACKGLAVPIAFSAINGDQIGNSAFAAFSV
jgi:hypothetical protein